MVVPDIFDSYLLIGDETAIPAIGRRLEELPAGRQVLAVIQIEDEQERQPLPSKAQVDVIWVRRQEEDLLALLKNLTLPQGRLYGWVALEKALTRQAKALLLEKGVQEDALKAAAYWRADGTADDA
jgi:NADPH-dependent ferric siderophore reductase